MSRLRSKIMCAGLLTSCLLNAGAAAQDASVGRTPIVAAGRIGQRQTREEAAPNIEPLGRVDGRIANRVQSRLRNRIDRFYDPQANASSPFAIASDQIRTGGR